MSLYRIIIIQCHRKVNVLHVLLNKWRQGDVVVSMLDFQSDSWKIGSRDAFLCCLLRQEALLHIVSLLASYPGGGGGGGVTILQGPSCYRNRVRLPLCETLRLVLRLYLYLAEKYWSIATG